MTYYANYTTLDALKTQYLDITTDSGGNPITVDDALLGAIIRDTSRLIERSAQRTFAPRLDTRYFDAPKMQQQALVLDDDLLALTSVVNGDNDMLVPVDDFVLHPYNERVKHKILLIPSSAVTWQPSPVTDMYSAISVSGLWCFAKDGDFIASGGVLTTAAITSTTATTFTATKNKISIGWLIQIGNELMYVQNVATGATEDQITVVRGVNGSTATTHLLSAGINYWQCDYDIEMLCRQASAAAYRIRANPIGDTVVIDGTSFATPKDVSAFVWNRLGALGYRRVEVG